MKTRRDFMKFAAGAGLLAAGNARALPLSPLLGDPFADHGQRDDHACWADLATRLADPVLGAPLPADGKQCPLETLGCLLFGLAPWLELGDQAPALRLADLARQRLREAVGQAARAPAPAGSRQTRLFETALLAQALMRAPRALWSGLGEEARQSACGLFHAAGQVPARDEDGRIFVSVVELALRRFDGRRNGPRLYEGLRCQHSWGGDSPEEAGPIFFQGRTPTLVGRSLRLEALETVAVAEPTWCGYRDRAQAGFGARAEFEEKLIAPDGSYPLTGGTGIHRCGAFQGLAVAAWRKLLPAGMLPSQARVALTAVLRRSLETPGTFDDRGWLQMPRGGWSTTEPEQVSRGSLYLCSAALLPLGLPRSDPFWTDPVAGLSWQKAWASPRSIA